MNWLLSRWPALASIGLCAVLVCGCVVPDGGYGYAGPVGYPGYYEPYGAVYGGWGPDFLIGPVGGGGYRGGYRGGGRGFAGGGQHAFRPAVGRAPSIAGGGRGGGGGARGGARGGGGRGGGRR